MEIGLPRLTEQNSRLTLSARVISERGGQDLPKHARFSVRHPEITTLAERADAFVVGMLPVAMRLGEDIQVQGPVSTRLAYGLDTWQDILVTWYPEFMRKVDIEYETLDPRTNKPRPDNVGCCFSGGADSFFALWELKAPALRIAEFQASHAVMINGFTQIDDLQHRGTSRALLDVFHPALQEWGVELVMIDCNLKRFRERVMTSEQMTASYSSPLAACAHALGHMFGRFSLCGNASYAYDQLVPSGSHAALDHHLGCDQLEILHTGSRLSRGEKIELLADQAVFRDNLYVCFRQPKFEPGTGNVRNCGKCEKCIRTIVTVDIIGALGKFPTLVNDFGMAPYRDPRILSQIPNLFLDDLIALAQRHGRTAWEGLLRRARAIERKKAYSRRQE